MHTRADKQKFTTLFPTLSLFTKRGRRFCGSALMPERCARRTRLVRRLKEPDARCRFRLDTSPQPPCIILPVFVTTGSSCASTRLLMLLSLQLSQPTGGRQSQWVTRTAAWELSLLNVPDRRLGQNRRLLSSLSHRTPHSFIQLWLFLLFFLFENKKGNRWQRRGSLAPVCHLPPPEEFSCSFDPQSMPCQTGLLLPNESRSFDPGQLAQVSICSRSDNDHSQSRSQTECCH